VSKTTQFVFFMTFQYIEIREISRYGNINKNDYNVGGLQGA